MQCSCNLPTTLCVLLQLLPIKHRHSLPNMHQHQEPSAEQPQSTACIAKMQSMCRHQLQQLLPQCTDMRLLGELYNYSVLDSRTLFDCLHLLTERAGVCGLQL